MAGDSGVTDRTFVRIVMTGSESVGKTTLGERLAARLGALCVPEFVREFTMKKGAPPDFSDREALTIGQVELEELYIGRTSAEGRRFLMHDTDLVSNIVYSIHYFGSCPEWIEQLAVARQPTHYLLLDIDVPWVPDGVRDRGDQRHEMHALFVNTLQRLQAPYSLISGDWDARYRAALDVIGTLCIDSTVDIPQPDM